MGSTGVIARLALGFVAALGVAGCGTDDGSEGGEIAIVSRLSPDANFVSYSDIDAIREGLGLPTDAEPAQIYRRTGSTTAVAGLGNLLSIGGREFLDALSLTEADAGAVSSEQEIVISTTADRDGVEAGLREAGYDDGEGGALVRDDKAIALADGLIGIGPTPSAAIALVEDPPSEVREPFGELEGALISSGGPAPGQPCLKYAVTIDNPGEAGEVIFFTTGEPDVSAVEAPAEERFGEPRIEGDTVRLEVEPDPAFESEALPLPALEAMTTLLVDYEC